MYKNRGMFLETIINQTLDHYYKYNLAYIEKKATPVHLSFDEHRKLNAKKLKLMKSTVDYIGIWNGKYLAFEAKSFLGDYLPFTSLKAHQQEFLELVVKLKGIAFYLIYVDSKNEFYMLHPKYVKYSEEKHLKYQKIKKWGIQLEIEFPGIIDFIPYLELITF